MVISIGRIIKALSYRFKYKFCEYPHIPISAYPRERDGKLIQLLNGQWVSVSSLLYMAPELFSCKHEWLTLRSRRISDDTAIASDGITIARKGKKRRERITK